MKAPLPSIHDTVSFVRAAHAGAVVDGKPRWLRSMEVMALLPAALPGIKVTHADRMVALLRDILETTNTTEWSLLRAGFPEAVVDSVVRLSRFDAGFPYLAHLRVVAASRDLSAIRAAMAALLHEEMLDTAVEGAAAEARERRREAMAILVRGFGSGSLPLGVRPTLTARPTPTWRIAIRTLVGALVARCRRANRLSSRWAAPGGDRALREVIAAS
jgi:(p)ppGpp synthase/HD superfamily hydrolase